MKPADFFKDGDYPGDDLGDVSQHMFDEELVTRIKQGTLDDVSDIDTAYGLVELARDELERRGTIGTLRLDNRQMRLLMRATKATLHRLNIEFEPPFLDFEGFYRYWSENSMRGSWAARRNYLIGLFEPVVAQLEDLQDVPPRATAIRGVDGSIKNIIFASTGPKPEIVLRDAINNVVEVVKNGEYCLVYDRPLTESTGLTWNALVEWWKATAHLQDMDNAAVAHNLYVRLKESVVEGPEKLLFRMYGERYGWDNGGNRPAMLPQVYLHFDPLTRNERLQLQKPERIVRERMDFLLLLPDGVRIVIEVDGMHHYADGKAASPVRYSAMVSEDRALRLRGYEVYRFGGFELSQPSAAEMLRQFFDQLEETFISPN